MFVLILIDIKRIMMIIIHKINIIPIREEIKKQEALEGSRINFLKEKINEINGKRIIR